MKNKIRNVAFALLGTFFYVLKKFNRNKIIVLAYHDVRDSHEFEKQMSFFIRSGFTFIDIDTFKEHVYRNGKIPPYSILVTFDDGDVSVYEKGFPVLKKLRIPAILFIITELIDSSKAFWWNRVSSGLALDQQNRHSMMKKVKAMSNGERLAFIGQLPELSARQLSTIQLSELQQNGVFIGNHSHTHPMFDKCDEAALNEELKQTALFFRKADLPGYSCFAYPNGNVNPAAEAALSHHGIELAFLFDHRINSSPINPLRISRIKMNSDTPISELMFRISGIHHLFLKLYS